MQILLLLVSCRTLHFVNFFLGGLIGQILLSANDDGGGGIGGDCCRCCQCFEGCCFRHGWAALSVGPQSTVWFPEPAVEGKVGNGSWKEEQQQTQPHRPISESFLRSFLHRGAAAAVVQPPAGHQPSPPSYRWHLLPTKCPSQPLITLLWPAANRQRLPSYIRHCRFADLAGT